MFDPGVTASLVKNKRTTLERIEKFTSEKYFKDVNLQGKLYPNMTRIDKISHWRVPGKNIATWQLWKFEDIIKQDFKEVKVGQTFGPSWSTHWFRLEFRVPDEWRDKEVRIRWNSQSEAMVWNERGEVLQGLSSGTDHQLRPDFILAKRYKRLGVLELFYIEMVCSRMFGLGKDGMINPPNMNETFTLLSADICTFDRTVYGLIRDLEILHGLAESLDDDQRGYRALYTANQMINTIVMDRSMEQKTGMRLAAQIAKDFFKQGNGDMALTLAAIGNCHIDSAWLWTYTETKRKCARSWSATLRLMDDYPEMIFSCSQAQQFAWIKHYYPKLFAQIKERVKQERFIPVGATWVEMDGLLPSGESFMRQFLYGQQFYKREFGITCTEFWLPDTFGYSGQIPQICNQFDIKRFLTQKLSWNLVNKFPNHTFMWEGIDGSTVLTHFPPGDSYEMNVDAKEAVRTERNLRDKGRVSVLGFLYGYGDGGGGPTADMLERAQRLKDTDGCPKVQHMSPDVMFKKMEREQRNLTRWVGELYLELHNGTYTSQAFTKFQNRYCEFELRKAEMLLSMVVAFNLGNSIDIKIHRHMCEVAWKSVLLNQFHDVLPGSSIKMVYEDSDQLYEDSLETTREVRDYALRTLSRDSPIPDFNALSVINALPWNVRQVILKPPYFLTEGAPSNNVYVAIHSPPLSYSKLNFDAKEDLGLLFTEANIIHPPSVRIRNMLSYYEIENQFILTHVSLYGHVLKLIDKKNMSRDIFEKNFGLHGRGNLISFYDDVPLYWDAWDVMDYHMETKQHINTEEHKDKILLLTLTDDNPLRVEFEWAINVNDRSLLRQKISLSALDPYLTFSNVVTWKESHKFLKVEFDTGILSREASYDIQFGHIKRPNHFNTSWDSAKFETCGHKWADISEHNCGLAVLNNCKYGWSCQGSVLSLSLLRAPKAPDNTCDMGQHKFNYAIMPHKGTFQEAEVIEASYEFNAPLTLLKGRPIDFANGWLELIGRGVMLDAAKVSESSPNQVVCRLHEMYGSVRTTWLKVNKKLSLLKVEDCNGMEEYRAEFPIEGIAPPEDPHPSVNHLYVPIKFWPFQIRTIKLAFHNYSSETDDQTTEDVESLYSSKEKGGPIETLPAGSDEPENEQKSSVGIKETDEPSKEAQSSSSSDKPKDTSNLKPKQTPLKEKLSASSEDDQMVYVDYNDVQNS